MSHTSLPQDPHHHPRPHKNKHCRPQRVQSHHAGHCRNVVCWVPWFIPPQDLLPVWQEAASVVGETYLWHRYWIPLRLRFCYTLLLFAAIGHASRTCMPPGPWGFRYGCDWLLTPWTRTHSDTFLWQGAAVHHDQNLTSYKQFLPVSSWLHQQGPRLPLNWTLTPFSSWYAQLIIFCTYI